MKAYNQNSIEQYLFSLNKTLLPWEKTRGTQVIECVCGACGACGSGRKTEYPIKLTGQAGNSSV